MSTVPPMNINQFGLQGAPGQVDLQITRAGVLTGKLGTVSGSLKAGARVKLDATLAAGFCPQFVAAADNADAVGVIIRTAKKSEFVTGDLVQVAIQGTVVWAVANATIAPNDQLEAATTSGQAFMQPIATGSLAGLAIDPAVQNGLFRMIVLSGLFSPPAA